SFQSTTLPSPSSRLPLRSCLYTARKIQPWLWKSAICVLSSCLLNSVVPTCCRKFTSRHLPRSVDPSGFRTCVRYASFADGSCCFSGYILSALISLSHQV